MAYRSITRAESPAGTSETWDSVLHGWGDGRSTRFLRAYSDAVNRALVEAWLPPGAAGRILKTDLFDEAVGEGLVTTLGARADEVVGVDVSPAVVDAARARYPELDARCADTRHLPFPDASFAAVVSNSTLDHFRRREDIEAALAELRRVLKPGGRLIVSLDNGANPLVMLRNALPAAPLRALGVVPYPVGATCGPRGLRRLLAEAGFEVEATRALMHCPRLLARGAAALTPGTSERLLRAVLSLERLGATPVRHLTAQFVAASARRR
jgi:ubiquinone/menaquinone biosynthesis C-methylase UbiE